MRKWLIHMLGGFTREDLPNLPSEKVNISLITCGGYSPVVMKANARKRHSKNNTVVGFEIYKDGTLHKYLKNDV